MHHIIVKSCLVFLVAGALVFGPTDAVSRGVHAGDANTGAGVVARAVWEPGWQWTDEKMRTAAPGQILETMFDSLPRPVLPRSTGQIDATAGYTPDVEPRIPQGFFMDRIESATSRYSDSDDDAASERMVSPRMGGLPFTSRRLTPRELAATQFYRSIGKLFFVDPVTGQRGTCSAAIIERRLILTAAHCVFDRGTQTWRENVAFAPAYNGRARNSRPFCTWRVRRMVVTEEWMDSSGIPANDDFAVLQVRDRHCNGRRRAIGDYLGAFDVVVHNLLGNSIKKVGYPGNLDNGRQMQVTTSQVFERTSTINGQTVITGEIGSAQWKGSSGGPWIQNFGRRARGQVAIGNNFQRRQNAIVGVTSYARAAPQGDPNNPIFHNQWQYSGASILNFRFLQIRATACNLLQNNCRNP